MQKIDPLHALKKKKRNKCTTLLIYIANAEVKCKLKTLVKSN